MGRIAHIQLKCPHCGKTTDAYLPDSGEERGDAPNVRCEHCKKVFKFTPGMLYRPIGYVSARPRWAEVEEEAPAKQAKPTKKWWEFWK